MKSIEQILRLSLIWFIVFGILYFFLEPAGFDYINNYIYTSLYFLIIIFAMTAVFKKEIGEYIERFSPKDLLYMALFSIFVSLVYYFAGFFVPNDFDGNLPPMFLLREEFLVSKSFEIMFQQTFFMVSIYYLFNNNVSKKIDILLFGLYAMVIHSPMLFIPGHAGKILFAVSFFAGVIFSYCITKSKKGFIWSYMIHFGFYVLLGVSYWLGSSNYIIPLINK